jgi:glutathione S-transferase
VEAAREYVKNSLLEAARWLEDGRPYVMGEHFATPDILLASCLVWSVMYDIELPTVLAQYNQRVASRPAFKTAMACNFPSNAAD